MPQEYLNQDPNVTAQVIVEDKETVDASVDIDENQDGMDGIDVVANLMSHVEKAREHGQVTLIQSFTNQFTNFDTRLFYIPTEDTFVLGLDATVEGFILPNGEELKPVLNTINRSYLNNAVNLPSINFQDEETFINFVANLWLSYVLHNEYSAHFDPSFTLFSTMQSAYRNGITQAEQGIVSDTYLYSVSQTDAIHYNGSTREVKHIRDGEVLATMTLDDVSDEEVCIYQMADFSNTVTAQVLHKEKTVDETFQE